MTAAPLRNYRGQSAEERRAERRARLLQAGLDLLGSGGWQATTVTAVCERARLTPRYFYESFSDRDQLLAAIFDGVIDDISREVVAAAPANAEEFLRATASAFVTMAREDGPKGRAVIMEALGSEALMRRRIDRMHWFANQLAAVARGGRKLRTHEARRLRTASLIAAGGLIEMMIAWLEGELDSSPEQVIEDYTRATVAALAVSFSNTSR